MAQLEQCSPHKYENLSYPSTSKSQALCLVSVATAQGAERVGGCVDRWIPKAQ